MESCKPGSIADLATLANLDGKVLLNELKVRYQENNIYVSKYISKTGFLHLLESIGNDNFSVFCYFFCLIDYWAREFLTVLIFDTGVLSYIIIIFF